MHKEVTVTHTVFRSEARDRSLSSITCLLGSGASVLSLTHLAVSMRSNFQFHVISCIDIVQLLSVYSVGRW